MTRSYHAAHAPDVVVFPHSTEEVSAIAKVAAEYGAPIIPFGVGTSLEGHVAALGRRHLHRYGPHEQGGRGQCRRSRCEGRRPASRGRQLNAYIKDQGLFFPIDPGADATIGGMTATRASGTNAVRYGTMRENVLGLTVVLADGRIIQTGGRRAEIGRGL